MTECFFNSFPFAEASLRGGLPCPAPTRVDDVLAGGHPAGQADLLSNLQGACEPHALLQRGLQVVHLHAKLVGDAVHRVPGLHNVGLADVCRAGSAGGGRVVGAGASGGDPNAAESASIVTIFSVKNSQSTDAPAKLTPSRMPSSRRARMVAAERGGCRRARGAGRRTLAAVPCRQSRDQYLRAGGAHHSAGLPGGGTGAAFGQPCRSKSGTLSAKQGMGPRPRGHGALQRCDARRASGEAKASSGLKFRSARTAFALFHSPAGGRKTDRWTCGCQAAEELQMARRRQRDLIYQWKAQQAQRHASAVSTCMLGDHRGWCSIHA